TKSIKPSFVKPPFVAVFCIHTFIIFALFIRERLVFFAVFHVARHFLPVKKVGQSGVAVPNKSK
ncbi:MAG: hypothetical protein ACRC1U_03975, partial [Vibrionaceae bacterium]